MLPLSIVRNYTEYCEYVEKNKEDIENRLDTEDSYIKQSIPHDRFFRLTGYCLVCGKEVMFYVDSAFSNISLDISKSSVKINWRERLVCLSCKFNNRMRGAITLLTMLGVNNHSIYITEQTTTLYRFLVDRYPKVQGSEYLPDVPFGALSDQGVRSEDMTRLTFESESFDYVLAFDVMEHIYDYKTAMKECNRVLRPGGKLILTVPFLYHCKDNLVRAKLNDRGEIIYLLPAEYHGDPARDKGCLCFRYFGWEIMDDLMSAGFQQSMGCLYTYPYYGHLGLQIIFIAAK